MKLSLVVAQGVHAGKTIPITSPQFLIGRDPECNLRPASPAISKQHCGIFVREGRVFVKDYGSTNGTIVNGEPVVGEREVANEDKLKIGPLEFVIKIEAVTARSTVKATASKTAVVAATAAAGSSTPIPATPAPADVGTMDEDPERAAAILLAMDESGAADPTAEAKIPEGTTVMEVPAVPGAQSQAEKSKKEQADTSKAAADLLSKYMRRPRA